MARTLTEIREHMVSFLAGGPFAPFWLSVMDATETVDDATDLTDEEREWYEGVYDLVYMTVEGSVTPQEAEDGVLGPDELRAQLRRRRLDGVGVRPA